MKKQVNEVTKTVLKAGGSIHGKLYCFFKNGLRAKSEVSFVTIRNCFFEVGLCF